MQPGEKAGIFEVVAAHDDLFWMAVGRDRHLTAYLCMAAENLDDGRMRYHCTTTVEYRHWTGPLYFNLIKPFHFLIVRSMLSASVRQ